MIKNIVPTPKSVEILDGTHAVPFIVSCDHGEWAEYLNTFSDSIEKLFDKPLAKGDGGIKLSYDSSLAPKSYRFDSRDGVILSASDSEGILYAIATFLQVVAFEGGEMSVERALIEDYPDKDYRSIMVDLSREWHAASTLYKYVDVCFMLKVKYLHLHFIDSQRYTLPSKVFPRVTEGSRFYTYEQLESIRKYATSRGIIIVPEFEVPGHASVLTTKYPDVFANSLGGEDGCCEFVTEEGVVVKAHSVVCAGSEKTHEGVRKFIEELCEMFPESPYIHIGGDEANIKAWRYCSVCKEYMEKHGIEDEYELYSDFVGRVAQMVLDMGKTPIVWEGFPKKGAHRVPKETIVCAWESHYNMAYDLLDAGFKIINGSWKPLYIVPSLKLRWDAKDILDWNVYNWQHWWEHSEARLNPITVEATDRVLGAQLSVWECTFEEEIGRAVENLSALSERIWTVRRLWSFDEFNARAVKTILRISRLIQDV